MSDKKKSQQGKRHRRPTMLDVAHRAGVSKSLVSMVIHGDDRVSAVRKNAVLEAIAELNYLPNAMARGLVQRQTRILGVMVSDLRNPFFGDVVSGIQRQAETSKYNVIFTTGNRNAVLEEGAIASLLELQVAGLILAGPRIDDRSIVSTGRRLPMVVLNRQTTDVSSDSITNDDQAGAELAVAHCAALGHTRIAHIDGGDGAASAERRTGYERAMRRLGLEEYINVVRGTYTETGGYRGARTLFKKGPTPTAIFSANDLNAIGALNALETMGLTVPTDISLVGYDNTPLAALRHVSLTSVHQPGEEFGRMAVDYLVERLNADSPKPRHEVIAPSLVVRSTTGPPPFRITEKQ